MQVVLARGRTGIQYELCSPVDVATAPEPSPIVRATPGSGTPPDVTRPRIPHDVLPGATV